MQTATKGLVYSPGERVQQGTEPNAAQEDFWVPLHIRPEVTFLHLSPHVNSR